jgi:hypothetical protein
MASDEDVRYCPECGARLIAEVLNYWFVLGTDRVAPADILKECPGCGWSMEFIAGDNPLI